MAKQQRPIFKASRHDPGPAPCRLVREAFHPWKNGSIFMSRPLLEGAAGSGLARRLNRRLHTRDLHLMCPIERIFPPLVRAIGFRERMIMVPSRLIHLMFVSLVGCGVLRRIR